MGHKRETFLRIMTQLPSTDLDHNLPTFELLIPTEHRRRGKGTRFVGESCDPNVCDMWVLESPPPGHTGRNELIA